MAENKFKIGETNSSKRSLFRWIERQFETGKILGNELPVKYVPHILFVTMLGVIYVGNTHFGETTQRKVHRLQVEVEDLRADYTTLKAEYMYARLQSEVAKKVKVLGLEESETPPYKIVKTEK